MNAFETIKKELEPKLKGKELTLESNFKDLGLDKSDRSHVVL